MALWFRIPFLIGLIAIGPVVLAQPESINESTETELLSDEKPFELERIRVTGYHLKRMDIEGPAPVQVFDREDLRRAGINTLEEFARKLPLNFAPPPQSASFVPRGVSFDLRGIGVEATLVLVNGLRIAPYGLANEEAVDVGSIPVAAIDRIEILKDGASAVYGADALAGVVNIILRGDYTGIEASAGYGASDHGDSEEILADFVMGRDNGRGSIMFSISYLQRDPIRALDRDWAREVDYTPRGGYDYRSLYSAPPTFLRYDDFNWEADPDCGVDPQLSGVSESPWGSEWGNSCVFNWAPYMYLDYDYQRFGVTFSGRYELNGGLSLFADVLYTDASTENSNTPPPLTAAVIAETFTGQPYVPLEHPGNPFGTDGELFGRALDIGPRVYRNETRAWRVVFGAEGSWRSWDWRASALSSGNDGEARYENQVSKTNMQLALLGQGGPGGDRWYNPFGADPRNDPVLLDWLTTSAGLGIEMRENSADFGASRMIGDLPGGPIGMAIGLQYREQERDSWVDEALLSYDLAGVGSGAPISADRSLSSAYVEFSLPLLDTIEAQLAARYEHYSDFGSTTNPKIALRWQSLPSLMFRASWSTSFLAPNFIELSTPAVYGIGYYFDTVRCDYTGLESDCEVREYAFRLVGNPDLGPEEGESWFAGVLWEPDFLAGFDIQVDWWKFEHQDRIVHVDGQAVLDRGGDTGIIREPTEPDGTPGRIILIEETYHNFEQVTTKGWDTTIRYHREWEQVGEFSASLLHTYIEEWKFQTSQYTWLEGEEQAGNYWNYGMPRARANLSLSWERGSHGLAANVNYTSHYRNAWDKWVDGEPTEEPWIIGSYTTLDLQYSQRFERLRDAMLLIGCNNVTNEEPPYTNIWETEPFHDVRGRFYYMRWQQPIR